MTARGDTLKNGAANYFVLHRDPIDLTESASMAFLGLSLTCARCHNHPMEKWTQDQYYGMASLFSRVQLKDDAAPGDVVVMPAAEGEIRHPRTGAVMAPQPLDAAAVDPESRGRPPRGVRRLARPAREPVLRPRGGQPRLAELLRPRPDRPRGRPPRHQPRQRRAPDGLARRRLPRPRPRRQAPDPHDHDLGRLRPVERARARATPPTSKFLSHYPVKRLPAEVLLDAIARVTRGPHHLPRLPRPAGGACNSPTPRSRARS